MLEGYPNQWAPGIDFLIYPTEEEASEAQQACIDCSEEGQPEPRVVALYARKPGALDKATVEACAVEAERAGRVYMPLSPSGYASVLRNLAEKGDGDGPKSLPT